MLGPTQVLGDLWGLNVCICSSTKLSNLPCQSGGVCQSVLTRNKRQFVAKTLLYQPSVQTTYFWTSYCLTKRFPPKLNVVFMKTCLMRKKQSIYVNCSLPFQMRSPCTANTLGQSYHQDNSAPFEVKFG